MLTREQVKARLEAMIEGMKLGAESMVDLPPILLVDTGGMPEITPVRMANETDKMILAEAIIPALIKGMKPQLIILATDGWKKDTTNTHRIGEILTVIAKSEYGIWGATCEYTRDEGNKPVFGETIIATEGVKSRFFKQEVDHGPNKNTD